MHTTAAMEPCRIGGLTLAFCKEGARQYIKASYPVRYGRYAEIQDAHHIYQFNLKGEIKFIQGQSHVWHYNEWLKRTVANDWAYYTTSGYSSNISLLGEYYLPCFSYDPSPFAGINPFTTEAVKKAFAAHELLRTKLRQLHTQALPESVQRFLHCICESSPEKLQQRAHQLHTIIGSPVTVLPPDTRHVDYEVIPVMVADGCLYRCGFCSVKTGQGFSLRSRQNITDQIRRLRELYGPDLGNYNSLFLGQHDALFAGRELIGFAMEEAYERLLFKQAYVSGAYLFLFGSVGSLLAAPEALFRTLNAGPFYTYINIGLESAQQESLDLLKKPLKEQLIRKSFDRIMDINKAYDRIEITANFVTGDPLPESHMGSMIDLVKTSADSQCSKGAIYLSPLSMQGSLKQIRQQVYSIKKDSRIPVFLYLMQRL